VWKHSEFKSWFSPYSLFPYLKNHIISRQDKTHTALCPDPLFQKSIILGFGKDYPMPGNKFFYLFLVVLLLSACKKQNNGDRIILKLGHQANDDNVWHLSVQYFAYVVDSLSKGEIEVRIFPNEQLGKELDMIRSIEAGIDDMTITGESMQNWIEEAAFCGMPYLIRDLDHLNQVVDGPIGDQIAEKMVEKKIFNFYDVFDSIAHCREIGLEAFLKELETL